VTEFEREALDALKGIREALDALVMILVPAEEPAPAECPHAWVELGGERECSLCKARQVIG
jgi:hypothetical protein